MKGDIDKNERLKYVRNLRKSQVAKIYLILQYDKTLILINRIINSTYLMLIIVQKINIFIKYKHSITSNNINHLKPQ